MKTLLHIITILALAITPALADAKVKADPRKGRILELEGINAEFFVSLRWVRPSTKRPDFHVPFALLVSICHEPHFGPHPVRLLTPSTHRCGFAGKKSRCVSR